MKKILSIVLGMILTINVMFAVPTFALLDGSKGAVCKGLALDENADCADTTGNTNKVQSLIGTALNIFSSIIGIIALVMIMIAGVKYVTSQGESAQVNSAKNTILYAAIGLVIAALAQVFVRFVLSRFNA